MHKVFECNRANFGLCDNLAEGHSFNFKGKIIYVKETMSCDAKNAIYVLQCNGCKEYYIGQTGDKLRSRRTVHAQKMRDPSTRQLPLSEHIDICCRSEPKFAMFPFFKMHSESISARLAKEKHFINCFDPKLNVLWTYICNYATVLTSWAKRVDILFIIVVIKAKTCDVNSFIYI